VVVLIISPHVDWVKHILYCKEYWGDKFTILEETRERIGIDFDTDEFKEELIEWCSGAVDCSLIFDYEIAIVERHKAS
jgi:hypothetical protein